MEGKRAVLMGLFVLIWLSSLAVPESAAGYLPLDQEPLRHVLSRRVVVSLLLVCFLVQASHGPYYAFFSIYMERFGYSTALIGQLWALGVLAEIIIFLLVPMLLPRFGARTLLLAAIMLTTLRWLLTALYPDRLGVMVFSQTLHAASFGLYHAVMIALIHSLFVGAHQGRGRGVGHQHQLAAHPDPHVAAYHLPVVALSRPGSESGEPMVKVPA